jgi:hypothetical protein
MLEIPSGAVGDPFGNCIPMNNTLLNKIGIRAIELIKDNIKQGVDIDGKAYSYSTNPFWIPYNNTVKSKLGGKSGEGSFYKITRSKSGKLGMLVLGGYKVYKEKLNPSASGDFLTWSGKMLRSIHVLPGSLSGAEVKGGGGSVLIGFSDSAQSQKAFWFNVSGVGRSRKLWKFMGLRKEQVTLLISEFTPLIRDDMRDIIIESVIKKGL